MWKKEQQRRWRERKGGRNKENEHIFGNCRGDRRLMFMVSLWLLCDVISFAFIDLLVCSFIRLEASERVIREADPSVHV